MELLVFVLLLIATVLFTIEAFRSWVSLTAIGLACLAGAFLASSPIWRR